MGWLGDLERLTASLRTRPPGWWAHGEREAAARTLVERLADLGREAGDPVPAGAAPMAVAPYALGDQLLVLGQDLVGADPAGMLAAGAAQALAAASSVLQGPLRGARAHG